MRETKHPEPARPVCVLVYLDETEEVDRLIRAGHRRAEQSDAAWVAVIVETSHTYAMAEPEKDRIAAALRLASQLGGDTVTLHGDDAVAAVLDFARERKCGQIVVGRPRRRCWSLGKAAVERLIERAGEVDVVLVGGVDELSPRAIGKKRHASTGQSAWNAIFVLAATGMATGLGFAVDTLGLPIGNISVAYLTTVLVVAMKGGLRPAIFASLVSFLAFNFFFTEPRYTFAITDTQNILTVVFFLIAAVIVSNLTARLRAQMETTRENARRTANLYQFGSKVTAAATLDDVLWAVVHHVAATINGKSLVLLPNEGALAVAAGYPPEDELDEKSVAAAEWAWAHGRQAGRGSATLSAANWLFLPMRTARGPVGVLGVQMFADADLPPPETTRLLEALADQAAVAIERTMLVADIEAARVATERERLRSALLSSLSHDLRTPLVSIMGAASTIITLDDALDAPNRRELAQTIEDEAERLNRFVQNLLDMTKLGAGALKPRLDWSDLRDVVAAAVRRMERLGRSHSIRVEIAPDMPLLCLDAVLMEQAFFNLLDNACKYAPVGTAVKVWAMKTPKHIAIEVADQGPGIPREDRERVFDMFYRVAQADKQAAGTGLGLAICRGIIEAHGGTIHAEPGLHDAGTCIVIHLPLPPKLDLPARPGEGEA